MSMECSAEQVLPKREWKEVSKNVTAHSTTGRIRHFESVGHIIREDIGRIRTCEMKKEQSNRTRDRYLEWIADETTRWGVGCS